MDGASLKRVLEDRIDRRLAKTEADVVDLKDKVDFSQL